MFYESRPSSSLFIFSTLAGSFNQYDMPDCVLVSVVDGIWEGVGDCEAKL